MTKLSALTLFTLGLALAACGDNETISPDATVDRSGPRAVVVAGDFTAGNPGVLSTLELETREVKNDVGPAMAVGADPILRHAGNELFIVNRNDGNSITIVDDATFQLKEQLGTGAGSNPQDVAVVGNKLYVATFELSGLAVLTRGSTAVKTIELPKDDPDGVPNCNSVYVVDTTLYVSCELLDAGFKPQGNGKIYVVDTTTDTVQPDRTITLSSPNPFGVFEQLPASVPHAGDLLIPTVVFATGEGCVQRITPGATPTASCMIKNADLGGHASRITFQVSKTEALALIAVSTFPSTKLRTFDLASDTLWPGSITPDAQQIVDATVCPEGELVVSDISKDVNGLRIYSGTAELTKAPLMIRLPPKSSRGLICY